MLKWKIYRAMDRKTLELLGWKFEGQLLVSVDTTEKEYWRVISPNGAQSTSLFCDTLEDGLQNEQLVEAVERYYKNMEAKIQRCFKIALELGGEFGWDGYA